MNDLDILLQQTIDIGIKAGRFIEEEKKNFNFSKIEYKGKNDLVSFVDKKAEIFLVDELSKILPEAGFIAEEGTGEAKTINWVIDPLDGTTNFMHGLAPYSVSIGLMDGNDTLLGVVYEIPANKYYYARKDGQAYCNGERIRVSEVTRFEDGLYITGYPYKDFSRIDNFHKIMNQFLTDTHGIRRFGSAAADLAYVASGQSEGFFEFFLHPWDVCAGSLIVKQAGGLVSDFNGGDNYIFGKELIAGNQLHPQMLSVIAKYWNQ